MRSFLAAAVLILLSAVAAPAADELPLLTVPVRVHLVHSTEEWTLNTTLKAPDVQRIFGKVNQVWAQAGIRFVIESIRDTPANDDADADREDEGLWLVAQMPRERMLARGLNVFYVKAIATNGIWTGGLAVVKDTARLQRVPGGIDEPLPRVTSHELGHALGLAHRQDFTNLMASGTTGTSLNEAEINTARTIAQQKYGPDAKERTAGGEEGKAGADLKASADSSAAGAK